MKKISPKLLVRRFVLATSFPPFLQMYRAIYALMARMTVRFFRKYPAIKAVYLTRGGARGEILPLVSDLDFVVIVERMDEKDTKELIRTYEQLARATGLLDHNFEIYQEETLYRQYETIHKFQYRFMEGKATWKLLYGKDYLADLPALPVEKMYGGFYREIYTWWSHFVNSFLYPTKYNDEAVTRNYVCYKATSEIVKMNLGLNHGILTFSRSEALERAKMHLNGKERELLKKMEVIARQRFRTDDAFIVEETKDFLLNYLNHFYGAFRKHALTRSLKDIPQRVDCSVDEWFRSAAERAHVGRLVDYVKEKWSHTYRGAYLVPSAYFNMMDDMLLMVEVDPQRLPTSRELKELNLLHWHTQPRLISRIYLFLLLPNAAFRIDAVNLKETVESTPYSDLHLRLWFHRNPFLLNDQSRRKANSLSILSPHCTPDLFALIGRPKFALDGGGARPTVSAVWTPLVEHLLCAQKMLFYELLESPLVYKSDSLKFLRIFWKTVQLVIVNRSAQKDEILYPLTLPAVERALTVEGISLPTRLQSLADAYQNELEGKTCSIVTLIPEALSYLKEIETSFRFSDDAKGSLLTPGDEPCP